MQKLALLFEVLALTNQMFGSACPHNILQNQQIAKYMCFIC